MLSKKQKAANIGRFINDGKSNIVYVDNFEKVWTQKNISDLISGYRHFKDFANTAEYYKKLL